MQINFRGKGYGVRGVGKKLRAQSTGQKNKGDEARQSLIAPADRAMRLQRLSAGEFEIYLPTAQGAGVAGGIANAAQQRAQGNRAQSSGSRNCILGAIVQIKRN